MKVSRRQAGTEQDTGRRCWEPHAGFTGPAASVCQRAIAEDRRWGHGRVRVKATQSCLALRPHGLCGSCIESCRPECWGG